jgi:Leucine-rich repeat (LRR) protein
VLPEVLGACPALEMIGFKGCRIHTVPAAALPPTLRWLILTDNRIEALPATIGAVPACKSWPWRATVCTACRRKWPPAPAWSCCASPPTG